MDNVLIAYELIHALRNRSIENEGNLAMKLDMSKAYNCVGWDFWEDAMRKMGFNRWIYLVMNCVRSTSFTVLINGVPSESFRLCLDSWYKVEWNGKKMNFNKFHCLDIKN